MTVKKFNTSRTRWGPESVANSGWPSLQEANDAWEIMAFDEEVVMELPLVEIKNELARVASDSQRLILPLDAIFQWR